MSNPSRAVGFAANRKTRGGNFSVVRFWKNRDDADSRQFTGGVMVNLSFQFQKKRSIVSIVVGCLFALAALCAGPSSASADAGFSGKVTDLSLAPLAGVSVQLLDLSGNSIAAPVTTGTDGSYSYGGISAGSGVPAGSYRVQFKTTEVGNSAPSVYYSNKLSLADSDTLVLTDQVVTTGVNAVIGAWGEIGGKAIDAAFVGIAGVQVSICDLNGLPIAGLPTAVTKADGSYVIGGVLPATQAYKVKFTGNAAYVGQWYNTALSNTAGAIPVNVVAYATTSVTQVLQAVPTLSVAGRVTNALGAPIPNIVVSFFTSDLLHLYTSTTLADGTYSISGAPAGVYMVTFQDNAASVYRKQYYNLKFSLSTANTITISTGVPATNINAVLAAYIPIISGFSVPAVSNALTVTGISVSAAVPAGVSGYLLTESPTAPTVATAGWSATAPTSYTFASGGAKTLYAWAKGVAGDISAGVSQPLTITLPPVLTVGLSGTGFGSVNSVPNGIACANGSASGCSATFPLGSANLTATVSGGSVFAGWTGICNGSGLTCSATFSTDTVVSAIFNLAPVALIGSTGYATLQAAYDAATTGQLIQVAEGVLTGSLTAAHNVTVTIAGGYLSDYSAQPSDTTLNGQIFLRSGEVKFLKMNVK
jgi:hypothetical protein